MGWLGRIWTRIKVWGIIGAIVGAGAMSQKEAIRMQYNQTKQHIASSGQLYQGKTPAVGKTWLTKKDAGGKIASVGRIEIAKQSLKSYRPQLPMTASGIKSTGKGALYGAGAGAAFGAGMGIRKYLKERRKRKMQLPRVQPRRV